MPRGARLDAEGALHHVMVRGLEKRKIFLTSADRKDFIQRLATVVPKAGAGIFAWSLLPNHAHLLIRTGPVHLSRVMRKVLTGYAVSFNLRHKRSGHLFQNRYKSVLVEEEPYLLELVRYIHLNPLRAGVVKSVRELAFYPWCGHSVLLGRGNNNWQDCEYILGQFGKRVKTSRAAYEHFVKEGVVQGRRDDLVGGGLIRSIGGWKKVASLGRGREKWASDERILGSSEFVEEMLGMIEGGKDKKDRGQPFSMDAFYSLIDRVAKRLSLTRDEIMGSSRRRRVVRGRNMISYVAVCMYGMSLKAVAELLRISKQSVLRGIEIGEERIKEEGFEIKGLIS